MKIPWKWFIFYDVLQKQFPLRLEGVVERFLFGYFRPAFVKINGLCDVRIPDRLRCVSVSLRITFTKSRNRRTFGAIDLKGEQIIASYTHRPRRIKVCHDATLEFKCSIGCIIGCALI